MGELAIRYRESHPAEASMNDFGVIIAAYHGDFLWAKGCIGSLQEIKPKLPICVIYDGLASRNRDLMRLKELGFVDTIIDRGSVKNEWLRNNSFGWGFTKLIALWESPWEHFVYVDADTAFSGDIFKKIGDYRDWDMIIDQSEHSFDKAGVEKWFFGTGRCELHYPDFDWQRYGANYFCGGVFVAKRGIFPLEDYQAAMAIHKSDPAMFPFGEMGILNLMVFRAHQQGKLRYAQRWIQMMTNDHPVAELDRIVQTDDPFIYHFAGKKPVRFLKVFSSPMTQGREICAKILGNSTFFEDLKFVWDLFVFKAKRKIKAFFGKRV
jgi:hypothetical protein